MTNLQLCRILIKVVCEFISIIGAGVNQPQLIKSRDYYLEMIDREYK